MRKVKVDGRRVDDLDRRITGLEKKRIASHKEKKRVIDLDSDFNVESFWRWYSTSGWYKKKTQEIIEHSHLPPTEVIQQYDSKAMKTVRGLHDALCVALAKGWIPHQPSLVQYRFLMLPDKEAFYGGAAGGGKSDALLMGAIMFCHLPNYHAILFRKTLEDHNLPSGLIPRSKEWLKGKASWHAQSHRWIFPSKSTITFGYLNGTDDHFRYQSSELQYIGFDELTHIPESQARYLFSRLRRTNSQAHIPLRFRGAGNPEGKYVRYVNARYVDPETAVAPFIPAQIEDNPGLDKESYIDSLSYLDPITRERLQKGNWKILDQGQIFQTEWFEIVTDYPKDCRKVRYWDKAATAAEPGKDPDWTAGVLMTEKDGIYYIIKVKRFQGTPYTNEQKIREIAKMDGKEVEIFMEEEPGSSGKADIDHYARSVLKGYNFRGVRNTGSKEVRAGPLSSAAENGNVKLVKGSWNQAFLDELAMFPIDAHDDQVDAAAGAFSQLNDSGPLGGTTVQSIWK